MLQSPSMPRGKSTTGTPLGSLDTSTETRLIESGGGATASRWKDTGPLDTVATTSLLSNATPRLPSTLRGARAEVANGGVRARGSTRTRWFPSRSIADGVDGERLRQVGIGYYDSLVADRADWLVVFVPRIHRLSSVLHPFRRRDQSDH